MKYSHEGRLKHNSSGRYSFKDGYYFTSGELIEVFYDGEWLKGRIEYSHVLQDYYFYMEEEQIYINKLAGLKARI